MLGHGLVRKPSPSVMSGNATLPILGVRACRPTRTRCLHVPDERRANRKSPGVGVTSPDKLLWSGWRHSRSRALRQATRAVTGKGHPGRSPSVVVSPKAGHLSRRAFISAALQGQLRTYISSSETNPTTHRLGRRRDCSECQGSPVQPSSSS